MAHAERSQGGCLDITASSFQAVLKAQRSQVQSSDPLCYVTYCTTIRHTALEPTWTQFEGREERTAREKREELSNLGSSETGMDRTSFPSCRRVGELQYLERGRCHYTPLTSLTTGA